ncbi:DUF2478 domain-containing protein [Roseovarius sp. SCSIO 43702]|uniref:DUF2478 domain-containing protein n=1 Tax=Roseovarius sp. SCSIO 43702 TaxID=2823043 RepID=UPI001C734144|nr:DUF2478 domain-containing protein [Roseovarius sp. SCSIO 43702]QYX56116.1 DUF2478 domain-containing protein [Roseovarius sp. SCSIO 43702]
MKLATLTGTRRGETDRLLASAVAQLRQEGVRMLGAVRAGAPAHPDEQCESTLLLLPEGPEIRITQDLGSGSAACRMDAGALEEAVGVATARLASEEVDLVILNKFGLSEAEGRGFRAFIADALARDIPVVLGLSETHRAAFDDFAGGMATRLQPDAAAILDWCRAALDRASVAEPVE